MTENEDRKEHAFQVLNCTRLALLAPRFLLDEVESNDFFKECDFENFYLLMAFRSVVNVIVPQAGGELKTTEICTVFSQNKRDFQNDQTSS